MRPQAAIRDQVPEKRTPPMLINQHGRRPLSLLHLHYTQPPEKEKSSILWGDLTGTSFFQPPETEKFLILWDCLSE